MYAAEFSAGWQQRPQAKPGQARGSDPFSSTVHDLLAATAGKTRQQDHYHPPAARFDSADNS